MVRERLKRAWAACPAVQRRAQALAGVSGASLVAFAFLSASGVVDLPGLYPALVQTVLGAGLVVPAIALRFSRERGEVELYSNFANIEPPEADSVRFPVPVLAAYRKVRLAPARLAVALLAVAFGVAVGGSFGANMLIQWQVPLTVFMLALLIPAIAVAGLATWFILATLCELYLRHRFRTEVFAGLRQEGYEVVGPFSAEDVSGCNLLLRVTGTYRCSSWRISFEDNAAEMVWDASQYPTSSLWEERARRARDIQIDRQEGPVGLDPAV